MEECLKEFAIIESMMALIKAGAADYRVCSAQETVPSRTDQTFSFLHGGLMTAR